MSKHYANLKMGFQIGLIIAYKLSDVVFIERNISGFHCDTNFLTFINSILLHPSPTHLNSSGSFKSWMINVISVALFNISIFMYFRISYSTRVLFILAFAYMLTIFRLMLMIYRRRIYLLCCFCLVLAVVLLVLVALFIAVLIACHYMCMCVCVRAPLCLSVCLSWFTGSAVSLSRIPGATRAENCCNNKCWLL